MKLIQGFTPTHIFLLLYSNDITEDEKYTSMGLFDSEGNLIAIPGPKDGEMKKLLRKSYLARLARKTQLRINYILNEQNDSTSRKGESLLGRPEVPELTSGYLLKIANMAKEADVQFFLLAVPPEYITQVPDSQPYLISFSDKMQKWARKNNINYIDLSNAFSKVLVFNNKNLFFDEDIHFNKEGHKVVAGVFTEHFADIF